MKKKIKNAGSVEKTALQAGDMLLPGNLGIVVFQDGSAAKIDSVFSGKDGSVTLSLGFLKTLQPTPVDVFAETSKLLDDRGRRKNMLGYLSLNAEALTDLMHKGDANASISMQAVVEKVGSFDPEDKLPDGLLGRVSGNFVYLSEEIRLECYLVLWDGLTEERFSFGDNLRAVI